MKKRLDIVCLWWYIVAKGAFLFAPRQRLMKTANKDTRRFQRLGLNGNTAPRKKRGEKTDNCTERGAYSESKVIQNPCFVGAEAPL
jgi:hypothetical protein